MVNLKTYVDGYYGYLDKEVRRAIGALQNGVAGESLTYQIQTDKILRAGEAAVELVGSDNSYTNVKFTGVGDVVVTSDYSGIIIDGSALATPLDVKLAVDDEAKKRSDTDIYLDQKIDALGRRTSGVELEVASLEAGLFKSSEYRYVDYKVTGMHRDFIPNQGQFQLLDKNSAPVENFDETKFIVLGHPVDSNWGLSVIDLSPFSALRIVGLDGSLILTAIITSYIMNDQNLPELALKVTHSLDMPAPNADKYSLSVENAIRFEG